MCIRDRRALCEVAQSRTFDSGQVICRQAEHADTFFVILSGSVQVYIDKEEDEDEDEAGATQDDGERKLKRTSGQLRSLLHHMHSAACEDDAADVAADEGGAGAGE
eukprot:6669431-Prymnesium_polylepis.1